jgi:hypothetical protein
MISLTYVAQNVLMLILVKNYAIFGALHNAKFALHSAIVALAY